MVKVVNKAVKKDFFLVSFIGLIDLLSELVD